MLLFFIRSKKVDVKDIEPSATLIISAYNEEKNIREKIENSLSVDYPKDKLQVIVVSDASTDRTDEIVKEYSNKGIELLRLTTRKGKTAGLNSAVEKAKGEIVIFTDANALFNLDAFKMMVRNFNDPKVGCVTGESRYIKNLNTSSEQCESTYWGYENFIKSLEGKTGSMVGGDGAIYAIRKNLYTLLDDNKIADTLTPVQIVFKGYRNIYEPQAICYEDAAPTFEKEFQRKVRITNRAWYSLLKEKGTFNIFKHGFFTIQVLSHRVLRWHIPIFLILLALTNIILVHVNMFYKIFLLLQISFYFSAFLGYIVKKNTKNILFYIPYYFVMVNIASLIGVIRAYKGNVPATWETVRTNNDKDN